MKFVRKLPLALAILPICLGLGAVSALAGTVQVFEEPGFPSADTAPISSSELHTLLPNASFVNVSGMAGALSADDTSLLVLPYGSAFPESEWLALKDYLDRGHNLLVLGGRPFTRAAYRDGDTWKLREYSVRFTSELMIDQYEETPGSSALKFVANPDSVAQVPAFAWQRGFSPILHLSAGRVSERIGAAGTLDARITALAWGMRDGHPVAAPVIAIDHLHSRFTGGRWILLNSELRPGFDSSASAHELVTKLVAFAQRGAEELQIEPKLPLYDAGEPVEVHVGWISPRPATNFTVKITMTSERDAGRPSVQSQKLAGGLMVTFSAPASKGLHKVDAELLDEAGHRVAVAHSAFWMRDEAYLLSGSKLTVNRDYFEVNGKPLLVVGTTYMSSDAQRLYYEHPNVAVWDRDLGEIASAGLNMLRTGWWSGWDQLCDKDGVPSERTLRTVEAYLMTARKYNLPVQFNVFAFLPDNFGGTNAYLDTEEVAKEKTLYAALAARFGKVPFLAWDLINEPSFSKNLWSSRPNGDPIELNEWNKWLAAKYPNRAALSAAWNIPPVAETATLPVPDTAAHGLHDFYLFSEEKFAAWVASIRTTIHTAGSGQLITVGEDEGGNSERLLTAYYGGSVDFTANHSWNQNDNLLWNSLVAKQPGKPLLIQEMGVGPGVDREGIERRDAASQAALFERKVILSFAQGAGAIEWLWNTNADMTEDGEVSLGGVRADRTEKPEAQVLRGLAAFARDAAPHLVAPEDPTVAIVTSQAAQFSTFQGEQKQAQQRAVQALCYQARATAYMVAENQIADTLGNPRLAILPSPQALGEPAWQALLKYVHEGGNLLVTGPVNRDSDWLSVDRLKPLGIDGNLEPLTFRTDALDLGGERVPATFSQNAQNNLEFLRFQDGKTLKQHEYGRGRIFLASDPVELAEEPAAAAELYAYVLKQIGFSPLFQSDSQLSPGVLVYPTILKDAILYLFASTDAANAQIAITDRTSGAHITLRLSSQHAAALLLDRKSGKVLAHYGD